MKVLITGGAGFIGSHVADKLLDLHHEVVIIDNYKTGKHSNNKMHELLEIREGTVTDEEFMEKAFNDFKPDAVIHAAASFSNPLAWEEDALTNISGTLYVVKNSINLRIKRFVYLQTSLCYGLHIPNHKINTDFPYFYKTPHGGSSYAISKTAAEEYIALSGLNFVSLRLANVYGPRNLSGPIPTFVKAMSQNQTCILMNTRRDFIYVDDVVDVAVKACLGKGNGYYHVAGGKDYSIKEIFEQVRLRLPASNSTITEKERGTDDVGNILLDTKKTEIDFSWKAGTDLISGIEKTLEWYRSNPVQQTFSHLKEIYE